MTASVASFLTQAQKKGTELPAALSGALLLAAVRLSERKAQAIRPYQLLVDDDGALDLLTGDPPTGDGYAAPELRNGAVLPEDPRVLVYAAGALGYELITLTPPRSPADGGPELKGPLAPVVRKAMAERQQRYKTLADMARAIERIQARPSREEERLILAAVATSTPLPPAQKLAKIELQRAAAPDGTPEPAPTEQQPVFTQVWDPLEPEPQDNAAPPVEQRPEGHASDAALRVELQGEKRARQELTAAIDSRLQGVSQLGTRLALLEEQVRSSLPPPLSASAALARDVSQLLEQRRFADAERALHHPLVQNDAVLQFRLGQALASTPDPDGSRQSRAEAAFRRAAELDAAWSEPRAQLGALLWRRGKQTEARAQFQAALKLDPACPEALAILSTRQRPGPLAYASSAASGALAAAVLVLALRPPTPAPANPPTASSMSALDAIPLSRSPAAQPPTPQPQPPQPQPQTPQPQTPQPQTPARIPAPATRSPVPEPKPVPDPRPRPRKAASANRAAAESESAKGDKALRAFDTRSAEAAFSAALALDPALPSAHRGMGMVYVLLGRNAEAKAAYSRYLQLSPDAPDREQIARLISR